MTLALSPLYFAVPLLLYFGIALLVGIISLIKVIKLWKLRKIGGIILITGFIFSLTLFGFLYLIYPNEEERFGLLFIGPLTMIFLPYILHIAIQKTKKENNISMVLLISVAFTMLGFMVKIFSALILKNLL